MSKIVTIVPPRRSHCRLGMGACTVCRAHRKIASRSKVSDPRIVSPFRGRELPSRPSSHLRRLRHVVVASSSRRRRVVVSSSSSSPRRRLRLRRGSPSENEDVVHAHGLPRRCGPLASDSPPAAHFPLRCFPVPRRSASPVCRGRGGRGRRMRTSWRVPHAASAVAACRRCGRACSTCGYVAHVECATEQCTTCRR